MNPADKFEQMYLAQSAALRTFVHRRADSTVADDLVAEIFFVAWRRFGEAPTDPLPWLIGIARGVLANHRRGQSRRQALRERLRDTAPREQALVDADGIDRSSAAMVALSSLSATDQEILLLVAWDGLAREQAAAALQMTRPQFAVRLHRARRRFQRELDAAHQPRAHSEHSRSTSEVS